ncbi:MAG: enoyl-CoA hydratase/isomerase family protein [Dehalococcoidia bacterium]|nr:MAG: enoyl-CoA hydratase/isomerase family protein [Dehalococcoidia bacterium]
MADDAEVMQVDREGPVATLWLNRPERLNALNVALIDAACSQLALWEADAGVRVVLLRGRGRAFCAGDDLGGMGDAEAREAMDFTLRREEGYERLFKVIYNLRKPVVAVLHGHAVGAGAMIALASDIRIAASDARIGFPFVQRGITGGTALLERYIGFGKAHELLLTGDPVTGEEAERIGLVTQAVPATDLDVAAANWAHRFAVAPTKVLGFQKYQLHHGVNQSVDTAFAINSFGALLSRTAKDSEEGRLAFKEKRRPDFKGN